MLIQVWKRKAGGTVAPRFPGANRCIHDKAQYEHAGQVAPHSEYGKNLKVLLRIIVAICAVAAFALAGHYVFGQMSLQANEPPRDQSVHHPDMDNRADLLGVEQ